ncbi:MAG TPA: hypothetical protein VHE14_07070, partial [Solirubrobacteraceae bacterium]|nr:hypothetical protein [Solirubrobacteraceae bacterium]
MISGGGSPTVGKRRLVLYYVLLAAATAAVITVVLGIGTKEHPRPPVAGGYDVAAGAACLGPKIDVLQSGRFVELDNAQSTVGGQLELKGSRLTGTARCIGGRHARFAATAHAAALTGTIGGQSLSAQLRRDAPTPGALKPRAPSSVGGRYDLAPGSACLGGKLVLKRSRGA